MRFRGDDELLDFYLEHGDVITINALRKSRGLSLSEGADIINSLKKIISRRNFEQYAKDFADTLEPHQLYSYTQMINSLKELL
jgi:hypothetical protein